MKVRLRASYSLEFGGYYTGTWGVDSGNPMNARQILACVREFQAGGVPGFIQSHLSLPPLLRYRDKYGWSVYLPYEKDPFCAGGERYKW